MSVTQRVDQVEQDNNQAVARGPHGNSARLLIIGVVLATLVAVWLVPEEDTSLPAVAPTTGSAPSLLEQNAPVTPAPESESALPAPSLTSPAVVPQPVQVPPLQMPPPVIDDRPGAAARALIAELRVQAQPDFARACRVAGEQAAQGLAEDAYLLYFYAAREGYGPAAMQLGAWADPLVQVEPRGPFSQSDIAQAYKWYSRAAAAGEVDASSRLDALRAHTADMATAGDDYAQRLILQWQ